MLGGSQLDVAMLFGRDRRMSLTKYKQYTCWNYLVWQKMAPRNYNQYTHIYIASVSEVVFCSNRNHILLVISEEQSLRNPQFEFPQTATPPLK